MKRVILSLSLVLALALTTTSCSSDDTHQVTPKTQLASRGIGEDFQLETDVNLVAEIMGEDLSDIYKIKDRVVHDDTKEAEIAAYVVWDYVEYANEDKIKLKCFKFTTSDHRFTHSIVQVGTATLSVFGYKKEDGTWGFLVGNAFPGETC